MIDQYGVSLPGDSQTHEECVIVLSVGDHEWQTYTDPLGGACDAASPLSAGKPVQVEFWKGRVTAIYDGDLSWPTVDNPGHNNLLSQAELFFGVVVAVLLVGVLIVQLAIVFVGKRRK